MICRCGLVNSPWLSAGAFLYSKVDVYLNCYTLVKPPVLGGIGSLNSVTGVL